MSMKKSTQIHQESLNVMFDERLTFDFKNLEPEELNQGKLNISVFDANLVRKNVLIGSFEFDLTQVYYRKHHELYKQWIALTDITGDNEGVQGYLQVTIVVLGPKDEQYIHPPSEEMETEGSLLDVMMPPQVCTCFCRNAIHFIIPSQANEHIKSKMHTRVHAHLRWNEIILVSCRFIWCLGRDQSAFTQSQDSRAAEANDHGQTDKIIGSLCPNQVCRS